MTATFSLLCPTRKRPQNIEALIASALDTAVNPDNIEFVFYTDDDDKESRKKLKSSHNIANIKSVTGPRIVLSQMWNECLETSTGNILMHCGDDIVFSSKSWDANIQDAFNEYPDKIALVYGRDGIHDEKLSTHSFVTRTWTDILGYICPPYFSSDWNDQWLFDIAKAVDRLHYLASVYTEHMHPSAEKAEIDITHKERMDRGTADDVEKLYHAPKMKKRRMADIHKLQEVIDNYSQ